MRSWYVLAFPPLLLLGCPAKESSSTAGAGATSTAPAASSAAPGLAPQTTLAPLSDTPTATATGTAGTEPAAPTGAAVSPNPKASATGAAASAAAAGASAAAAGATNALRIKQCCDALRKTTATLAPASTEAQTVLQAVALCDGIAAAVTGPATVGQAPEFAPVRPLLQSIQGKSVPAGCQGL